MTSQPLDVQPSVRAIAFYLPQFHPIPENDEFWGRGFTEWTNVTRAVPRFRGHLQPRLPGELGFYDLRIPDIQFRQAQLAQLYGVEAFCFYFYWFGGRRLLELPLDQFATNPDIDLPFCICWANENWTRTWDGAESRILIGQDHSAEDDINFISYVSRYLRSPRYVRVAGKPILIIYRPHLLPDISATAQRWRLWCRDNGIGEIHLAYVQSFENGDPIKYGLDAAIEFPPNNMGCPLYGERLDDLDPSFRGFLYDWEFFPRASANYSNPSYRLYRGVCPSWDNEARRPGRGAIFVGNTPDRYREWLKNAASDTISRFSDPSERLVFINAWNEWAEGAYLEPDRHNGYAYLSATRTALTQSRTRPESKPKLALVGHDAHPHGAQFLLLHLIRAMTRSGIDVECILLRGGTLEDDYRAVAPLRLLAGADPTGPAAKAVAEDLKARGFTDAIANTTACGLFTRTLTDAGLRVISLVHEQSNVIKTYEGRGLLSEATTLAHVSQRVVFPNNIVRDEFCEHVIIDPEKVAVRPQGLYKRNKLRTPEQVKKARRTLRSEYGWDLSTRVVLAVGFGDRRKGLDLFVDIATQVLDRESTVAFLWVGNLDADMEADFRALTQKTRGATRLAFAGFHSNTDLFYAGSDLLVLPSREDPFPSVLLEAFDSGLPAVAFGGVGGFDELFTTDDAGSLVTAFDTRQFAEAVIALLRDHALRQRKSVAATRVIRDNYSFSRYVQDLLHTTGISPRTVSVVIPNYNYCCYLDDRLRSVSVQTYSPSEIIVIDDASTDGSVQWLTNNLNKILPDAELTVNRVNSGSVFRQWYNGCRLATGDFLWIAEADDLADPAFLETILKAFDDPDVVVSYCQSRQMASDGTIICPDYLDYVADISTDKWRCNYVADGVNEIRCALAVKNTIPNVSAVVFRRSALLAALEENLDELERLRVAGDWLIYVDVLRRGKIAFVSRALNSHRRHTVSVTSSTGNLTHLKEILMMQGKVRDHFAPSPGTTAIATTYAETLYGQFGLATPTEPTLAHRQDLCHLTTPTILTAQK